MKTEVIHGQKIEAYNVPKNCCVVSSCGTHATYFYEIKIGDMKIHLMFCKRHYEQFDEAVYESYRKKSS